MSIATFKEFLKTIDPESQGFTELAKSVASAPDLAAYAQKHGIELSKEEAADVIESGKRELEATGGGPLSEDALEKVSGGIALDTITFLGRIASTMISPTRIAMPPHFGVIVTGPGPIKADGAIDPIKDN